MITPMKRAFVVVVEKERKNAVRELRKLGIMHLEPMQGRGEPYHELAEHKARLERAWFLLTETKVEQQAHTFTIHEAIEFGKHVLQLSEEISALHAAIAEKTNEIERIAVWGDFDPALLTQLADAGIALRMLELPAKRLSVLPQGYDHIVLGTARGRSQVLLFAGRELQLSEEALEFQPSDKSLSAHRAELQQLQDSLAEKRHKMAEHAVRSSSLKPALAALDRELAFENLHSGMNEEGPVCWFGGWVPAAEEGALQALARQLHWGLILDEPKDDEQPPTKVDNPPAIRMVQPIFDFLGTVPNYREYDISGLFLFYFAFFFAMIFGDGGYGALLLLAGIFVWAKMKLARKKVPDAVNLLLFMSAATVIWGIVTGTWFGIAWEHLPAMLRRITIPAISNGNADAGENIKVLCFMIGLTQLGIAHIKNFIRDWPSPKLLAQLGQLGMLAGIFFLVLNLVINPERFPLPQWAMASIGAGFALNFLFANYVGSKGFFKGFIAGILESLTNIVSVLLGVVNIFADVVSYIRLWAVGLAGLAISQTVNNMAGPLLGSFVLFAAGVALLVFGHGLNLIMALLSVIVHGVRLNMLEFSGHLGMEWSGYKYEPFRDSAHSEQV